jgi:hypothetical protein
LEPDLEKPVNPEVELLATATYHARDAQARCVDVAAMLFPTGHIIPSDSLISGVSSGLHGLVSAIQKAVMPSLLDEAETAASCWQLLSRSGFLREPPLIDFMLARYAEQHLSVNLAKASSVATSDQLPALLLDNVNPHVAEASQILLAAGGMRGLSGASLHHELSPELLHQTVWRVVAALQILRGMRDVDVIERAKELLATHEEGQIARVAARKLVHFLGDNEAVRLSSPETAGLDLYISALAADVGIDHDHVLRLIDAHSCAPFVTVLKARGMPREDAMATLILLKGFDLTPREISVFDEGYNSLSQEMARAEVERWAIERASYLAFSGQMDEGA